MVQEGQPPVPPPSMTSFWSRHLRFRSFSFSLILDKEVSGYICLIFVSSKREIWNSKQVIKWPRQYSDDARDSEYHCIFSSNSHVQATFSYSVSSDITHRQCISLNKHGMALLGIPTKAASISQVLQMNECIEGIWWVEWLQNFLYLCFYV